MMTKMRMMKMKMKMMITKIAMMKMIAMIVMMITKIVMIAMIAKMNLNQMTKVISLKEDGSNTSLTFLVINMLKMTNPTDLI